MMDSMNNSIQSVVLIPVKHSILELFYLIEDNLKSISKTICISVLIFTIVSVLGYYKLAIWCLWWVLLGILSSIGLGFGMHTFVLFLGPHIAAVTTAAHFCNSLNFPEPPYPNDIICPTSTQDQLLSSSTITPGQVTFFNILRKVALESFMWGLGTAIGELPPYLAARLKAKGRNYNLASGDSLDGLEIEGWELWMIRLINKIGFFGIVLFAAIPNPLFDVAGLASGIAQVPFLSFFGATMIGKAIIKVLLQSCFVIFIFHGDNLELLISSIQNKLSDYIPSLRDLNLSKFLEEQRSSVKRKQVESSSTSKSSISYLFSWLISLIMILFVISVIRSLDQQYKERIRRNKIQVVDKKKKIK